jgi:hypothetical protein
MADDELDELYRVKPDDFTALRTRLAEAAKKRGDAAAAKRISAARRPTTAAWVVNRLALGNAETKQRLADLGERLRAAHTTMDGDHIRLLSGQQRGLIHELARAAFEAADLKDPPAALRDDVTDTLQAAIADPDVAEQLGRLTKPQRYSGFGEFGDTAAIFAAAKDVKTKAEPARADKTQPTNRAREEANAALAAAQRAKADAEEAVAERHAELDAARRRHDDARRAVSEAERELHAAEDAYDQARLDSRGAAEQVRQAQAKSAQRGQQRRRCPR